METKLSKTLYMEGLRCPRLLWYRINQPGLANSPDLVAQYLYQEGHKVEEHARRLYPGGILINKGYPAPDTCLEKETQIAMQSRVPAVYEASFSKGSCNCRTDIMHKFNGGSWNLTEVKMCSRLKPEHIDDVAFQLNCIKETDYHIDRAYLLHVNTKYIRRGEINPHQLFTTVDITAKAREQIEHVQNNIQSLVHFAQVKVPPPNVYGRHCEKPGKCPFYDSCIKDHTEGSVYDLPYGRDIIPRLISMGITRLADIPSDFTLSKRQSALVASVRIGSPVDVCPLREASKKFVLPRMSPPI